MRVLVPIAQSGQRLSRPFQLLLNAAMQCAAEAMRRQPLPLLYTLPRTQAGVEYKPEPWAGDGVEEFADPYTVYKRHWGDCDDLVIWRGGELLAQCLQCHARILHDTTRNKYHTQLTLDYAGIIEDPSLERLGKPYRWRIRSYS